MKFSEYLKQKGLSEASINRYCGLAETYITWITENGLTLNTVRYKDLLGYIKHLKYRGLGKRYMNLHLTAIRHLYDYRVKEGKQHYNPASATFIKGVRRRLPHDLLEPDQLHALYDTYQGALAKKVILGLIIFQALKQEALTSMSIKHCHLDIGKIYIQGTAKYDNRTLELEAKQILVLREYIASREGKLFNQTASAWMQNQLKGLIASLKQINPQVKNASQLRASTIAGWLKTKGVREVQYMAGHKYVSSTERYEQTGMEKLKQQLEKYHPLG